ncbi:MAG: phosphoglycerate dehydrogenase, partial [Bdellovibrionales bacterium]|nr:phosphoglycerate dehydrogenase [Bdellovibrionales bacterium]
MNEYRVLLLENIHPLAQEKLEEAGFQVDLLSGAWAEDELVAKLGQYQALGIRSKTQITPEVLAHHGSLFAIGCFCIGTNQVALEAANEKGLPVFNAPYSNTRSVAELIICELIALSRQVCVRSEKAHQGIWMKSAEGSHEVRGKTLGIVGYGHIGSQVSVLAEAMGLKVIFYDVVKKLPLGNAQPVDSLEILLRSADFVTLHVPQTPFTANMMGEGEFKLMKKGSFLLNASRGTVVKIDDLAASLRSGHLAGAAIDVFPEEPASNKEYFISELQKMDNVILTPHVGGSTEEAQKAIGEEVADSLIKFLRLGSTYGAVNFPTI